MASDDTVELNYRHQLAVARHAIQSTLAISCKPIVSTKFSEESAIFLHLVSQVQPGIAVIWVDTGYNTRATQSFASEITERLDINLHTFEPLDHTIIMPPALDDPEHAAFSREVKVEPFQRALKTLRADAWLSSIRRYQSTHRKSQPMFQTLSDGMLKTSPLLDWTAETMTRYRLENQLPLGAPCFDPTKGEAFRECGLHLDRSTA
ncbi:phosphoadenosine phosphosulfate reductase family protein [Granulosicoccus antarcticus]|uniref:Phosphoadenosine phosphosulfate reductase n=1 Tax=Granulosicoccus antarcticus IMCC3135 TaxID=1192854 RepID=A0A2Z2NRP3_9GAMM|nr:phosphoadenosine phosphosulfate reductase family protein [Granulosicoccus antarcticus]ASJ74122.1 Phosphoadenosine phosphosulfate reductase [Granulosicoccus antarcticus IMCC3135]